MNRGGRLPTVAERRFAEHAAELTKLDLAERFARIHDTNLWDDAESRSGAGSALASTAQLRAELPELLRRLGVRRLLDVPCGDFHWMAHVDLAAGGVTAYVGGDVVRAIVEANRARYAARGRSFVEVDLTRRPLPHVDGAPADAVLCRDCAVLVEGCEEEGGAYADKALAAWHVADLPSLEARRT